MNSQPQSFWLLVSGVGSADLRGQVAMRLIEILTKDCVEDVSVEFHALTTSHLPIAPPETEASSGIGRGGLSVGSDSLGPDE